MVFMDLLSIIQLKNTPFDESNGIELKCYGEEQDYPFQRRQSIVLLKLYFILIIVLKIFD